MPKRVRVPNLNLTRDTRPRPDFTPPRPIPPETWNLEPETPARPWTDTVEGPEATD
jgi:hypothetical protein